MKSHPLALTLLVLGLALGLSCTLHRANSRPDWHPPQKKERARLDKAHAKEIRKGELRPAILEKPVHVIFTFVDHWEPGDDEPLATKKYASLWLTDYARMAARHHDADGRAPQHTWFCEFLSLPALQALAQASFADLGELEVHIHHGTPNDEHHDNTAKMAHTITHFLEVLHSVGACLTAEPKPHSYFGFIHGKWALDNSRVINGVHGNCGVNQELDLLRAKGCYADFTFPAWGSMQPRRFSKILACVDTPAPKSYGDPQNYRELQAGAPPKPGEFVLIMGPGSRENIDQSEAPTLKRMQDWVKIGVHVPGRDNWIFVKVHSHGAQSFDFAQGKSNLIGANADRFYREIEAQFNDGKNYQLHYATAREMYNIAMAAADGKSGNPNDYRDYKIARPASREFFCDAPYRLLSCTPGQAAELQLLTRPKAVAIWAKELPEGGVVLEKDGPADPYRPSDASLARTGAGPWRLVDRTPSRFYRIAGPGEKKG